jgi:hypothetical protein
LREAAQLFEACLELATEDKVAQIYLKRCQHPARAAIAD